MGRFGTDMILNLTAKNAKSAKNLKGFLGVLRALSGSIN